MPYYFPIAGGKILWIIFSQRYKRFVKCDLPHLGFELVSPCSFPTTMAIPLRVPSTHTHTHIYIYIYIYIWPQLGKIAFYFPNVGLLQYECTTWTLIKHILRKLGGNCTRILLAILNKSWKQYLTKRQLYDHLRPISKTIQIRRTRHVGHSWRSLSSWHAPSTDLSDPLSPPVSIVHCSREIFKVISTQSCFI